MRNCERLLDNLSTPVSRSPGGLPPQASYWFKHALVQDAAYGTLRRDSHSSLAMEVQAALSFGILPYY